MFSPLGKLLCAAALAGVALAQAAQMQNISIPIPASGTNLTAGQNFTVQVERTLLPSESYEPVMNVGLVIACCSYNQCQDPNQYLGQIILSDAYNPQPSGAMSANQNFTVRAPDMYDGYSQITVALFYVYGSYSTPKLVFANTTINIQGVEG